MEYIPSIFTKKTVLPNIHITYELFLGLDKNNNRTTVAQAKQYYKIWTTDKTLLTVRYLNSFTIKDVEKQQIAAQQAYIAYRNFINRTADQVEIFINAMNRNRFNFYRIWDIVPVERYKVGKKKVQQIPDAPEIPPELFVFPDFMQEIIKRRREQEIKPTTRLYLKNPLALVQFMATLYKIYYNSFNVDPLNVSESILNNFLNKCEYDIETGYFIENNKFTKGMTIQEIQSNLFIIRNLINAITSQPEIFMNYIIGLPLVSGGRCSIFYGGKTETYIFGDDAFHNLYDDVNEAYEIILNNNTLLLEKLNNKLVDVNAKIANLKIKLEKYKLQNRDITIITAELAKSYNTLTITEQRISTITEILQSIKDKNNLVHIPYYVGSIQKYDIHNKSALNVRDMMLIMADIYKQVIIICGVIVGNPIIYLTIPEREDDYLDNYEYVEVVIDKPNIYQEPRPNEKLYGYWPYKFKENKHKFNINNDNLCITTSLTDNKDFMTYTKCNKNVVELTAEAYYRQNITPYTPGIRTQIRQIHDKISIILNVPFYVEYTFKNSAQWDKETVLYPGNIKTSKKDIDNKIPVFKVLRYEKEIFYHIFNVNDELARKFLMENVDLDLPYRVGYTATDCMQRDAIEFTDLLVNKLTLYYKTQPMFLYNQFKNNIENHVNELPSYTYPMTMAEAGKLGIERSGLLKITKKVLDARISKLREIQNNPNKKIPLLKGMGKRYTAEPLLLRGAMDFEGSNNNAYSCSYNFFDRYGPVKNYTTKVELPTYNLTIGNECMGIDSEHMKSIFDNIIYVMGLYRVEEMDMYIHNFGGYDWVVLMKDKIMAIADNIRDYLESGNKAISISVGYKNKCIRFRDSLRMFTMSLNKMSEALGVKDVLKTKFMYRLYNAEYNINKPYQSRKLIWTYDELLETCIDKDDDYKKEMTDFLDEYGHVETYDLVQICRDYCNMDTNVLRNNLLTYEKLICGEDFGRPETNQRLVQIKCMNIQKGKKTDQVFIVHESLTPLDCPTLPSFVNNLSERYGAHRDAVKLRNSLAMYVMNHSRGGRCFNRLRTKFLSTQIAKILNNPYFYISDEKLANYLATYLDDNGLPLYDVNKPFLTYPKDEMPESVVQLKESLKLYGSVLCDLDGISLYPSAVCDLKWFPTGKPVIAKVEDIGAKISIGGGETDKPFYAYFEIKRTPTDIIYMGDTDIEFAIFTKKENNTTINMSMYEKEFPLTHTDYIEFKKFYPKAEIKFLHGITFNSVSAHFSDFVRTLFNKRKEYKALLEDNPTRSLEGIIKLMLNSLYGNKIRKPTKTKTEYLSVHKYEKIKHVVYSLLSKNIFENGLPLNNYIINEELPVSTYRSPLTLHVLDILSKKHTECTTILNLKPIIIAETPLNTKEKIALRKLADTLVMDLMDKSFKINDVDYTTRHITSGTKISGLTVDSPGITNEFIYACDANHATMTHWGVSILSSSKTIMNRFGMAIKTAKGNGFDFYYTDTDSMHVDGSYLYNKDVQNMIGKEMGQMHSDFQCPKGHFGKDVSMRPLDKVIGLCSILSFFVDKKFYFDLVMGEVVNGNECYISAYTHSRHKGFDSDAIPLGDWDGIVDGYKGVKLDLLLLKAMSIKQKKGEMAKVLCRDNGDKFPREFMPYNDRIK